jgi:hypothetical protein
MSLENAGPSSLAQVAGPRGRYRQQIRSEVQRLAWVTDRRDGTVRVVAEGDRQADGGSPHRRCTDTSPAATTY